MRKVVAENLRVKDELLEEEEEEKEEEEYLEQMQDVTRKSDTVSKRGEGRGERIHMERKSKSWTPKCRLRGRRQKKGRERER